MGIKIKAFSESIDLNDFNLVTVKGNDYYTFRCQKKSLVLDCCQMRSLKGLKSLKH